MVIINVIALDFFANKELYVCPNYKKRRRGLNYSGVRTAAVVQQNCRIFRKAAEKFISWYTDIYEFHILYDVNHLRCILRENRK